MDKAIQSLYQELLREAHRYRVSISVLSRFHKKMGKVEHGKVDSAEVIIPLIREIEKAIRRNTREREKESALASMVRRRARFSELRKEEIYGGK